MRHKVYFLTGSCADFLFKPLRKLLHLYLLKDTGENVDLSDKKHNFHCTTTIVLYPHVVAQYFDLRT